MKIITIPTKKLALLCTAFCAAAMLAFTPDAKAVTDLTFNDNDQYRVGYFKFGQGTPADGNSVRTYVNYMISLNSGGSGTFSGMTFFRTNNAFANLPQATYYQTGGIITTINLGAGGLYTYLFAKYDGKNDYSQVWYVGNLTGTITIPENGPLGHGLSGLILFGPDTPSVPDGGTTVMLLGAALGALGIARRYIMR